MLDEPRRRSWEKVTRVNPTGLGEYKAFPMFGGDPAYGQAVWVSEGGWCYQRWLTTKELKDAKWRWAQQSYATRLEEPDGGPPPQCGGCRYFAAIDGDFGLCCNPESPMDGHVMFEHGGCPKHSAVRKDGDAVSP